MTPTHPTRTCPAQRFPTEQHAADEIFIRRIRASLAGTPTPERLHAYGCQDCGGAHIRRTPTTDTEADSTNTVTRGPDAIGP